MRPTVMRVSTDAIARNARRFRERIPASVRMMCVIKADAYGHGAAAAAKKLLAAGADAFAVAIVEEAKALRAAGIRVPILILGGAGESSLREAVACDAPWMLDAGHARVGVRDEAALKELLARWQACPEVEMEGAFTHFCVADTDPEFTEVQRRRFVAGVEMIRAAGFNPIRHAAATSAMLNPALQFDMVRPGIGLYGTGVPEMAGELECAQTLVTRPIRIQRIAPGDTVGYGRTFTAERDTLIMTLPIGYGDGYPRILSNRAHVLVKGVKVKQVGRVCMDMIMADVTDVPGVTLDDEVVLLGAQGNEVVTPDELAEAAETIPYEIMLGFLERIPVEQID